MMSDTIETSLMHRVRHTPLRDVLRGRLTGRLDVEGRIEASGLPAEVKAVVRRVVRRTRLRALERVDVADELMGHFADGLESGQSVGALIEAFGDERVAARLIGRAKRRQRGVAWQMTLALGWGIVGLFVLYGGMAAYYYSGRPTVAVNYVEALNRDLEGVGEADRAWPFYREALVLLAGTENWVFNELIEARPGDEKWEEMVIWLEENCEVVELIRRGAERPVMGFVAGRGGSASDPVLWPHGYRMTREAEDEAEEVFMVLLPHLNEMRKLANLLAADTRRRRHVGDGQGAVENIEALIGLSEQMRERFIVQGHVALAIGNLAFRELDAALVESRELIGDEALHGLAHRLAGPRVAADLYDLEAERLAFLDQIQRIYTDDGRGGGRMTPDGVRHLRRFRGPLETPMTDKAYRVGGPALPVVWPSRREVVVAYDRIMNETEAQLGRPIREADWESIERELGEWSEYSPLDDLMPKLRGVHVMGERYLGQRDGVVVGIALEVYRRRHGTYPESLEELVPALLPAVPADRFTGEPVRYRLIDGRPVVYSVGPNRRDDGGRPSLTAAGEPAGLRHIRWDIEPERAPEGDWVLHPTP